MKFQVIESSHRAAKHVALGLKRGDPGFGIDVESGENGRKVLVDRASLAFPNLSSRPVDKLQILLERNGQRGALRALGVEASQSRRIGALALHHPNPLVYRREFGFLGCLGNSSTNGIEIHLDHGREQTGFIEERLALEAPLPESTGAVVFLVGTTRLGFVQAPHEPTDIHQSIAPALDDPLGFVLLCKGALAFHISLDKRRQGKELCPSRNDLLLTPLLRAQRIDKENRVIVIRHHRIGADVHGKDQTQLPESIDHPLLSVRVVASCVLVVPIEP